MGLSTKARSRRMASPSGLSAGAWCPSGHAAVEARIGAPDEHQRPRAAREVVGAAQRGDAGERARERGRRRVADEAAHRVAEVVDRAAARDALHLLDGGGDVLAHVVGDVRRAARAEVTRAAVSAQIEVEDVEPRPREVVGEGPRGQVPGVAVLPVAVHQEHRRQRAAERSDPGRAAARAACGSSPAAPRRRRRCAGGRRSAPSRSGPARRGPPSARRSTGAGSWELTSRESREASRLPGDSAGPTLR